MSSIESELEQNLDSEIITVTPTVKTKENYP